MISIATDGFWCPFPPRESGGGAEGGVPDAPVVGPVLPDAQAAPLEQVDTTAAVLTAPKAQTDAVESVKPTTSIITAPKPIVDDGDC
jgi:hypothetical protein